MFFAGFASSRAEELFFKKGDVIAIVGGEDMVALSEYGYLELLLTRALPDFHLRFRNLAWEGDTVFEQRRDLNFPPWEEQLEKIGATVVLCQFGQMESLAGKEKLPEFIAAYEKLLERLGGGGKRRVVILSPTWFEVPADSSPIHGQAWHDPATIELWKGRRELWTDYTAKIQKLGPAPNIGIIDWTSDPSEDWWPYRWTLLEYSSREPLLTRDRVHLSDRGHGTAAGAIARMLLKKPEVRFRPGADGRLHGADERLLALIIAKNRLWFDYWRVQNWAFLAGDRTNQPSSRDHLDPAKRWFPEERERFLPLIEAREKEIDALAAKLAQP